MTEPAVQKKGVHPLVWVGLGCGALLLVGFAFLVAGGIYFGGKVKDFAEDMEANPVMTAARLYAAVNPDVEVVSADEERQEVTLRSTRTGEEVTVDLQDLQEGRISFRNDQGEVRVGLEEGPDGGGRMTVESQEGTLSVGAGGSVKDVPPWVPIYPGANAQSNMALNTEEVVQGVLTVTTSDSYSDLVDFYRDQLEDAGFDIEFTGTGTGTGTTQGTVIVATQKDEGRSLNLAVTTTESESTAIIHYNWTK